MSGLGTTALLRTADVPNICVVGADVLGDRNVRASLPNARAALSCWAMGAAALAGAVAAIVVGIARSGAMFMSRFPGTRARQARGLATRWRSFAAASRCNFNCG